MVYLSETGQDALVPDPVRKYCKKRPEGGQMKNQTVKIEFSIEDFYNVINAMRDACGCVECQRITKNMIDQRREIVKGLIDA